MTRRLLALALVAAVAWLYGGQLVGLVVHWATNPDASYGAILAAFGMLLLWQRRRRLFAQTTSASTSVPSLTLLLFGLGCYLAGQLAADVFTTRTSFVFVAAGLLWFLLEPPSMRVMIAPFLFMLLAIPLPELLVTSATGSLQHVATRMAEFMLTTGGIPVYRDGNILELPTSTIQVVEACSGMRSVLSLGCVGVFLAWTMDGGWGERAALVLVTTPIAVVVNAVRLAATGAASETWGAVATRDPWHSLAGWLTFVVSLLVLWAAHGAIVMSRRRAMRLSPVSA